MTGWPMDWPDRHDGLHTSLILYDTQMHQKLTCLLRQQDTAESNTNRQKQHISPQTERKPTRRHCRHRTDRKRLTCLLGQVGWLVGCLTSQQHASVSQGRICSDNFTCCHTETEVADPTFYLTQSQYTDTGPTSPSADPITPGAWQGSHWNANF